MCRQSVEAPSSSPPLLPLSPHLPEHRRPGRLIPHRSGRRVRYRDGFLNWLVILAVDHGIFMVAFGTWLNPLK
ncbi:hypothetical protein MUK42_34058 [Musa troglodytarum]|uniref:Uncharacterized protein n=1 Tax=Musa troglodytarum TaxID=320322 RepID=A0A9E7HLV1_9LILI|nr:hypothetical protein MUK42_34058 [Musa troglodytarum]